MRISREHINSAAQAVHRYAAEALARSGDSATCGAVSRRVVATIDGEFAAARAAGAAIACAPGCTFCCHLRVGVLPHEAVALWRHVRTSLPPEEAAAIEQRVVENARRIDGMTAVEHRAANIPCALLRDGRCSAYEVRPAACAAYHSLSRERCERSFRHPRDAGTPKNARPALLTLQAFSDAVIAAARAGATDAGVASPEAELHQSLRALIDDPRAISSLPEGDPCPKSY
jgi:Fe-S-cluster containining protein